MASRSEGWLAGLQLVALSLQGRGSLGDLLEEVSGSQRYIFDYLIEEVFGRQSASVQTFLLSTSVLKQLCAPLCDAVLKRSGSQQVLEQLERANLFLVSLDGQRHWYRYHTFFAEALRYRLEQIEQHSCVHSPLAHERKEVARVRILLAQQMPAEALSLLEPLQESVERQERWSHVIEMKVLQALALALRHEDREALTILAQAVHLAEPEGYIRIFVDEGAAMATLLSRLRDQERKQGPTPYFDTLLAAFSPERIAHKPLPPGPSQHRGSTREQPLIEPLSERELEVLQLLAQGDSNQEIADRLVIAVVTVKRHVTHIFEKLGVNNRVQAVAQARAFGLLSDEP